MAGKLIPDGKQQFFDNNGDPLVAGTVDFYEPGTTTLKDTYQDRDLTTLNTNPVVLDAAGRAVIWGRGLYRQVVKDSSGNTIWDQVTSGIETEFGNAVLWGGVSTGTPNAQVLTVDVLPDDVEGYLIGWIAGYTNTDEMTIEIVDGDLNTTGALSLLKGTENGPSEMEGGEIVEGNLYVMALDSGLNAFQVVSHIPKTTNNTSITVQKLIFHPYLDTDELDANTNNWNPTGLGDYTRVKIYSSMDIDLTGITAAASVGTLLLLENWGAFNITLKSHDANSLAQNRFDYAADVVLGPDENVFMIYDSSGWRLYHLQAGLQAQIDEPPAEPEAVNGVPNVIIENIITVGNETDSIGFSGGAYGYQTYPLNTLARNVSTLASLASSQFTLPAGTYLVMWDADIIMGMGSLSQSTIGKSRIYNVTDDEVAVVGHQVGVEVGQEVNVPSADTLLHLGGAGVFTLATEADLEFQYAISNGAANGIGRAFGDLGEDVTTGRILIWKAT